MIIINLMGGLGNQMFQYAAAKHLSIIHNTSLKIDTEDFRKLTVNKEHILQLDCMNIRAEQAFSEEIKKFKPRKRLNRMFNRILRTFTGEPLRINRNLLYEEPAGSAFKDNFFDLGPDRYLIGYFNSYKYFDPIRNMLIEEYSPWEHITIEAQEIIKQIEESNSVSIHIRRGDYVNDPNVHKGIAGIITDNYYKNAVNRMAALVDDPHFYVFSNDMPWVRENFKIPFRTTYVDINSPQKGYEDLWIMSKCRHNITAGGSTFSWWAAYLNQNASKIVVRTERINNDPQYNHPDDYFPPGWETVPS
ncbi:MAG: alpha-1,2-fucosyltransferase [Syntrophales bacterium LBB04]|nr:alpha-1,2-fucosyltransferase [Syntrophales bacterium LBB04]